MCIYMYMYMLCIHVSTCIRICIMYIHCMYIPSFSLSELLHKFTTFSTPSSGLV